MTEVGQVPVVVRRELDGFILNRLQGALLSEAMRLVGEGYVSPEDLDKTVAHGLGLRWSFMGPFATIELNAPGGVADYCARYSGFYRRLAADPPAPSVWDGEHAARVVAALGEPLRQPSATGGWTWRDRRLLALARHKRDERRTILEPEETHHGRNPQSHHHLRDHRLDPYAVDVAAPAGHAARDRRRRRRRGRSRRGDRPPARARPGRRPADAGPEVFREFAPDIKRRSDVVINFTTGGAATMTIEERLQPALQLKPEVASLNMGSMNFGLYPMLEALQGVQVRLGARVSRRLETRDLQATRSRTSSTS